ncbi:hypothetical protein WMF40_17310 [Sorangium sp. So ce854]
MFLGQFLSWIALAVPVNSLIATARETSPEALPRRGRAIVAVTVLGCVNPARRSGDLSRQNATPHGERAACRPARPARDASLRARGALDPEPARELPERDGRLVPGELAVVAAVGEAERRLGRPLEGVLGLLDAQGTAAIAVGCLEGRLAQRARPLARGGARLGAEA